MSFAVINTKALERTARRALKVEAIRTVYNQKPPVFRAYAVDGPLLYRPLRLWRDELTSHPHRQEDYTRTSLKFSYPLYTAKTDPSGRQRDQDVLVKLAIDQLKTQSTTFIAAHTGYGKCLGKGEGVMMFDGRTLAVENVKQHDLLMGEGGAPRLVLGVCSGIDMLYTVRLSTGESFVTNGNHIIVAKFFSQGKIIQCTNSSECYVIYFDGKYMHTSSTDSYADAKTEAARVTDEYGDIFELSILTYLALNRVTAEAFRMYWSPIHYVPKLPVSGAIVRCVKRISKLCATGRLHVIPKDYAYGSIATRVAILSHFSSTRLNCITSVLRTRSESMATSVMRVMRSLGYYSICNGTSVLHSVQRYSMCYVKFTVSSCGGGEYYGFELDGDGRFLLGNHIVSHNTSIGTYLLTKLRYKTAILCPLDGLKKQWKDEIEKFTDGDAVVQIVRGRAALKDDADVYIIGTKKASTMERDDLMDIGMVMVDEAHMSTAILSKSLLNFQPRYVVGLSATPDRADGLTKLLELHFGHSSKFLTRHEVKNFTVIKYVTDYVMDDEFVERRGTIQVDWTAMVTALNSIEARTIEIAKLAIDNPEHKIMILCDRVHMATYMHLYLQEQGESSELYIGSKKTWDKSKRILITGVKKGGVGLNDPDLTMLILAADMKDVRQCEGRIRTVNNVVYDIIDRHRLIESHWCKRRAWYRHRGAIIVDKDGTVLNKVKQSGDSGQRKRLVKRNDAKLE